MAIPSPSPVRYPSGVSTDFPWGPLRSLGAPSPFKYQIWADDFEAYNAAFLAYTATKTNSGTIAAAAGAGGQLLFTTDTATTDLCSIQLPVASFVPTLGKKAFFLCRLKVSSAANAAFLVGLIQTTTTPFTVTDGIYFSKPTGAANNLVCNVTQSSTTVSKAIPTGAYTLADATTIDLAWHLARNGDVEMWVGSDLVGWQGEDQTLAANTSVGPVARSLASDITLPTANLNFTLAVRSGTGTAKTMTVDFAMAAVER